MAIKKRNLRDLYQVGKEVTFDDGTGDPVTVYLRKLSPIELETVLRNANARRASYVAALRDPESREYQEVYNANVERLADRDSCISVLVDEAMAERWAAVEAEIAAEEEWSKDEYLQGLYDAWRDLQKDSESEDAKRVQGEMVRFNEQVAEAVESLRVNLMKGYDHHTDEDVSRLALKALLKFRSDQAWMTELNLSEVWMATRDPDDKRTQYFLAREDLNILPSEVLLKLMTTYRELQVPSQEGKDSDRTPDSSSSSDQPSKGETSEPSGQQSADR